MKIAIITYHYSSNNGAVMQTYALCRFLKERGYCVSLIDIRQDESAKQPLHVKILKYIVQRYRINKFIKKNYRPLTMRYESLDELKQSPPQADCYIVGSDQVWNPDISKSLRNAYFLDFGDETIKRVSYASSFGLKEWPSRLENDIPEITLLLNRFCALSVREKEGQELCESTFGLKSTLVLDPCFLNDDYVEIVGRIKQRNEIVCYKLNKTMDFYRNIDFVKSTFRCSAILLNENYPQKGLRYCFNPSVKKWMSRIAGAKFVVTDSFHGIVFCILFHKQFIATINNDGKDSRLVNLMHEMGLEKYLIPSLEFLKNSNDWLLPINYEEVDRRKMRLVEMSRSYLLQALK